MTSESLVYDLIKTSEHPNFKEISNSTIVHSKINDNFFINHHNI